MPRPLAEICLACGAGLLALVLLSPASVADGPTPPPPIVVDSTIPLPQIDGATGLVPLNFAAPYAWNLFIALNWPASAQRGVADASAPFGSDAIPVWETLRSKNEVYPGNASPDVGPHGAEINPVTHKPTNPPDFGYGDKPDYIYSKHDVGTGDGRIAACKGQMDVLTPAWISLDETTEIGVNQTFAGVLPARDESGKNSKPQLIRYAVKMNKAVYQQVVSGQYWYSGSGSPLEAAAQNFTNALAQGQRKDPNPPFVNFAPPPPAGDPNLAGIELKTSWRPLTTKEAQSGHFFKTTVRYYEKNPAGFPCYHEAEWGLLGMHVISFPTAAPWVIWSTFEQADNILSAAGNAMEDADGRAIAGPLMPATSPELSSNPNLPNPTVMRNGDYCTQPGARLFFQENPAPRTLPADGDICVNHRWHPIPGKIIAVNANAHQVIREYLAQHGNGASPWLYYKLINVQGIPVDAGDKNAGTFSTTSSYYMANSTIETDYSLGMFAGNLVDSVPTNVTTTGQPNYNTQLLPFQAAKLGSLETPLLMGGCGGCHAFAAAQIGQDFSFALGDNVKRPEPVDAFKTHTFRDYFRSR